MIGSKGRRLEFGSVGLIRIYNREISISDYAGSHITEMPDSPK